MILKIKHAGAYVAKVRIIWKEPESDVNYDDGIEHTCGWGITVNIPNNATNICFFYETKTGLVFDQWRKGKIMNMDIVPERTITLSGTTLNPYVMVEPKAIEFVRSPLITQLETYKFPQSNEIVVWRYDGLGYTDDELHETAETIQGYFEQYGGKAIAIPKDIELTIEDIDDLINRLTKLKEEKSNANS